MTAKNSKKSSSNKVTQKKSKTFKVILGIIIFGFIACLIIIKFLGNQKTEQQQVSTLSEESSEELIRNEMGKRQIQMKDWLDCGDSVASLSNNVEAKDIIQFLRSYSYPAIPYQRGTIFDSKFKVRGKPYIKFVNLNAVETFPGSLIEQQASLLEGAGGYYQVPDSCLVLKNRDSLGVLAKGLLICHEGNHARGFQELHVKEGNDSLFFEEEVRAHTLQNKILSQLGFQLGGKEYDSILQEEKKRIQLLLKEKKIPLTVSFPPADSSFNKELAALFGPYRSASERELFQTVLWIHALFEIADTDYPAMKGYIKRNVMFSIYKKTMHR